MTKTSSDSLLVLKSNELIVELLDKVKDKPHIGYQIDPKLYGKVVKLVLDRSEQDFIHAVEVEKTDNKWVEVTSIPIIIHSDLLDGPLES